MLNVQHLENNPFTCKFPDCGHKSNSLDHLRRHFNTHFAKNQTCSICQSQLASVKGLQRHMKEIHSDTRSDRKYTPKTTPVLHRLKRASRPTTNTITLPESLPCPRPPSPHHGNQPNVMNDRIELESVHIGEDGVIQKECQQALLDVKEELELSNSKELKKKRQSETSSSDSDSGLHKSNI